MKIQTIILAATLLLFTACRKNKTDNPQLKAITGSWKLVRLTGGIGGIDMTPAQWGHTKSYEFRENYRCKYTYDGKTTSSGYELFTAPSRFGPYPEYFMTIAAAQAVKYRYYFTHDTLILAEDMRSDIIEEWYVRQ